MAIPTPTVVVLLVLLLAGAASACPNGQKKVGFICVPVSTSGVTAGGVSLQNVLNDPVNNAGPFINAALATPTDIIKDTLAAALDISNTCTTVAVRDAFSAGGWTGYYGKRIWDSKSVALLVGSIIPASSAVAVEEIMAELRAQYTTFVGLLEKAATDIGESFQLILKGILQEVIDSLLAGKIPDIPPVDKISFGLKVNVLRVDCKNKALGVTLPSEGNFQLALAWRIKGVRATPQGETAVCLDCDSRFKLAQEYIAECKSTADSQSYACIAAAHKACSTTFGNYGGVVSETGCRTLGINCFEVFNYLSIEWPELTAFQPDCKQNDKSNWFTCLSAAHRACNSRGSSGGGAGILFNDNYVGVASPDTARIACFQPTSYVGVEFSELTSIVPSCTPEAHGLQPCASAINRYCYARGHGGGVGQELGATGMAIACFARSPYKMEVCF